MASGLQLNRMGENLPVPRPGLTWSHPDPIRCGPAASAAGSEQLVTTAPAPGNRTCPPWVWPATTRSKPLRNHSETTSGQWTSPMAATSAAALSMCPVLCLFKYGSSTPLSLIRPTPDVIVAVVFVRLIHPRELRRSTSLAVSARGARIWPRLPVQYFEYA